MERYFEMNRCWPEGCASLNINKRANCHVSHLDVYKNPCGEIFLKNFEIIRLSLGDFPDLLPNNLGWFLASPRLCEVFEKIDSELKAFIQPMAQMQLASCHDLVLKYSLVSAAKTIDCLDVSNPALTWFDAERNSLQKRLHLPLLRSKIPKGAVFFAVNKVVSTFVVSEGIHNEIMNGGFSGVAFRACELV